MYNYSCQGDISYIAASTNGGTNWNISNLPSFILNTISCSSLPGVCYAAGSSGSIFKIDNYGASVSSIQPSQFSLLASSQFYFHTISSQADIIYIASDQGCIYGSYDGGSYWIEELCEPHENEFSLLSLSMLDSVHGLSADSAGNIYLKYPAPTSQPSQQPSEWPSCQPSSQPSTQPSKRPSSQPSSLPTGQPTRLPSSQPTLQPSTLPSNQPTTAPSALPSRQPSSMPSHQPISRPSSLPSRQPSRQPTGQPSRQPSSQPSVQPISSPTSQPSIQPSRLPTSQPSRQPSTQPTTQPVSRPTTQPSQQPSNHPSQQPISKPSMQPSRQPSRLPSMQPSRLPTRSPSAQPTRLPTKQPAGWPSSSPTRQPSSLPTHQPSRQPTGKPSQQPIMEPSSLPSSQPSSSPSMQPASKPSMMPSNQPSSKPSLQPFARPSMQPSSTPTNQPTNTPTIPYQTSVSYTFTAIMDGKRILNTIDSPDGRLAIVQSFGALMPQVSQNFIVVTSLTLDKQKASLEFTKKLSLRTNSLNQRVLIRMSILYIAERVNIILNSSSSDSAYNPDPAKFQPPVDTRLSPMQTYYYYNNITFDAAASGLIGMLMYNATRDPNFKNASISIIDLSGNSYHISLLYI